MDAPRRKVPVDPPRAITAFAGGEWWPGVLEEWEQRQDGSWWGFCTVAVMQWVNSPLAGLVNAPDRFIRWMPAEEIRERDGALVDVEAWVRANEEAAAPARVGRGLSAFGGQASLRPARANRTAPRTLR